MAGRRKRPGRGTAGRTGRRRRTLKKPKAKSGNRLDSPVFFFDEARFGLKPVTGRLWAKKGVRPIVHVRPGCGNFHAHSAVCPATGEDVTLFLPRVNTGMMNLFLGEPGKALGGRRCLLVMDGAGTGRRAWMSRKT